MRNFIPNIFIAILIAIIACIFSPAKYSNALDVRQIDMVKGIMVVITTKATVERVGEVIETEMEAIAIRIGNGQVIAETHATQTPTNLALRSPFGYVYISQKILTERYFIDNKEIKLLGRHRDISLFQTTYKERHEKLPFGNSDKLEIGTDVIVVGWSFGKGINVKTGIVSRFITTYNYISEQDVKGIVFMITAPVNAGDSGSPVLANKDGRYELVGLVCAKLKDHGLGFAYDINFVKKAIRLIMETSNE